MSSPVVIMSVWLQSFVFGPLEAAKSILNRYSSAVMSSYVSRPGVMWQFSSAVYCRYKKIKEQAQMGWVISWL